MSGEINVFDEWGNYMGKFQPAGGGCLEFVGMLAAYAFLAAIIFLFFLVKGGVQAIARKNWSKAILYLLAPTILLVMLLTKLLTNTEVITSVTAWQVDIKEVRINESMDTVDTLVFNGMKYPILFISNGRFMGINQWVIPGQTNWVSEELEYYRIWKDWDPKDCSTFSVYENIEANLVFGIRGTVVSCLN